jgi:hypothetical protein
MLLMCPALYAPAQVSIGISLPGLSIGINQPTYPELVPVPGYPVYYAPGADSNYFFYDGMYWVYQNDGWYSSAWYNGPWGQVDPMGVPLFVLRVPVSYYRRPPAYFGGWDRNAPPRWGEHWGHDWQQRRGGWDHWDRNANPQMAPLPTYQRQYSGGRYPSAESQQQVRAQNYHYQPREAIVRSSYQQPVRVAPAGGGRPGQPNGGRPASNPPPRPAFTPQANPGRPTGGQSARPAPQGQQPMHQAPQQAHEAPRQAPQGHEAPRQAPQGREAPRQEGGGHEGGKRVLPE